MTCGYTQLLELVPVIINKEDASNHVAYFSRLRHCLSDNRSESINVKRRLTLKIVILPEHRRLGTHVLRTAWETKMASLGRKAN